MKYEDNWGLGLFCGVYALFQRKSRLSKDKRSGAGEIIKTHGLNLAVNLVDILGENICETCQVLITLFTVIELELISVGETCISSL